MECDMKRAANGEDAVMSNVIKLMRWIDQTEAKP